MATIKSIPSGYGPKLVQLILDLGRILEAKLYYSSEPQANRFEVIDSHKLSNPEFTITKEIIEHGLRTPHFISERAFRPKQAWYTASNFSFSINNIFTPVLRIPPEKRWSAPITVNELKELCSDKKEEIIRNIIDGIHGKKRIVRGKNKKGSVISGQQTIIDLLHSPVNLNNCPVTGVGCNKNLTEYIIHEKNLKSFLAVPFRKDVWVYDPRRWIKTNMNDNLKIRCVDVDDFPDMGVILCKICSCVRQMPIGMFEITELNPNVIFELGMATGLNKLNFMLVNKEKIPKEYESNYPPGALNGLEYIPYNLSRNEILKTIKKKILPTIQKDSKLQEKHWCTITRGKCPHIKINSDPRKIFIGLPYSQEPHFFKEVENIIKKLLKDYNLNFFKPAKSKGELCQMCKEIRESSFCIIDTTSNDISLIFALGIAFGKDKKFIQLQNTSLFPNRVMSDLRPWAIEYQNTNILEKKLKEEINKRV